MASSGFTIEIDATKMREALEGESLKRVIQVFVKAAARTTADRVCAGQKARLSRQLSGTSTGATVAGIVVKSDKTGWGWVVTAGSPNTPRLAYWLQHGTRRMRDREFFDSEAALEQTAHHERVRAATQAAISQYGLGDGQ